MPQGETEGWRNKCPLLPKGSLENAHAAESRVNPVQGAAGPRGAESASLCPGRLGRQPPPLAELQRGNWVSGL